MPLGFIIWTESVLKLLLLHLREMDVNKFIPPIDEGAKDDLYIKKASDTKLKNHFLI